jgi:hypothetical protein
LYVDEKTVLVIDGRAGRAAHRRHPFSLEPFPRRIEQSIGHALIVDALKETEEADILPVFLVVIVVNDGADSSHDLPVPLRQEQFH